MEGLRDFRRSGGENSRPIATPGLDPLRQTVLAPLVDQDRQRWFRRLTGLRLTVIWDPDPGQSVCDVAYAVGYTDANYFRQAFKAHTGCAPSIWRQHHALTSR